jgi:hypothetical protein
MNWNAERMLSWRPRPALPVLKCKIFVTESAPVRPHPPVAKWFWGALLPATACVWLALATLNHEPEVAGGRLVLTLAASNQMEMAAALDDGHTVANRLETVTFDSTNHSGFNSNMSLTPKQNFIHE